MKHHVSFAGKLFLNRMFFNILTVCVIPIFIPIIDSLGMFGRIVFSAMVSSLYLGVECDMVWKLGKRDRQSYSTDFSYPLKGAVVALIAEIPFFLMYIPLVLSGGAPLWRALYRCLCIGPFMTLVPQDYINIGYLLVLFISPAFSLPLYIVGTKKPKDTEKRTLRDKILYKNK